MKAVIQRTSKASVTVEGREVATIGIGFLVLIGIGIDDMQEDADYIIKKIIGLRIFDDTEGRINKSLADVDGEVLLVSQFTLYADTKSGNRPSFIKAMPPQEALPFFDTFVAKFRTQYPKTKTGIFGANMQVALINDGPITIIIDSPAPLKI